MPSPAPEPSARRALDPAALVLVQRRLERAAQPPWLHAEVARRMAERLPVVRLKPARVLDWGAFLGASAAVLASAYPQAHVLSVEAEPGRRDATAAALLKPWWSARRWHGPAHTARLAADVAPGGGQLLWSNMSLHGVIDPQVQMRAWQRALSVDGFLMFSCLGPGSLRRLVEIYRRQSWPVPMAPLVDMHDLGDMLIQAGFADPVMDQETITLTWPSSQALLAELHQLGGNVDPRRFAGLRTPRWRARLLELLQEGAAADGRLAMDFEVVYGHAFKPPPRPRLTAQTQVPLEDMRTMVRAAGRQGGAGTGERLR